MGDLDLERQLLVDVSASKHQRAMAVDLRLKLHGSLNRVRCHCSAVAVWQPGDFFKTDSYGHSLDHAKTVTLDVGSRLTTFAH